MNKDRMCGCHEMTVRCHKSISSHFTYSIPWLKLKSAIVCVYYNSIYGSISLSKNRSLKTGVFGRNDAKMMKVSICFII